MILCEKIKKPDCFRKTSSIFIGNILNFDISDTKTEYCKTGNDCVILIIAF